MLFERCSGDYRQVQNAKDFDGADLDRSLHFGRLANVDEVYAFFQDFGLVQEDGKRRGSSNAQCAVNPHAGTLNRFLQFGECSRTTKTAGTYGEGVVPPVSFALGGNMHPDVAIPMERGEVGNHTGALKERILFFTAPRVQPHEGIPDDYELPEGVERPWPIVYQSIGL